MNTIHWYQFNWFDFAICAVIVLSIIASFFRGFLREAVSLITWIIAIVVALKFAEPLGNELSTHIESPAVRFILSFIIIFVVILIIGSIINLIIKLLVNKVGIGIFDRFLGILFGAARGILFVAILLMFLNLTALQKSDWLQNSRLRPHFQPLVGWLSTYLPEQLKDVARWITDDTKKVT